MTLNPSEDRRRLVLAGCLAAVVVAAVAVVTLAGHGAHPPGDRAASAATSTEPESFALPALRGPGMVSLSGLRGRPLVVDFFASWCTACQGELPGMVAISKQLAGRVTFVGVDSRENADGYAMASQSGITTWRLARDVDGVQDSGLHDALGAQGMPVTAFYNSTGRLLGVSYAALSDTALREKLAQYFGIAV